MAEIAILNRSSLDDTDVAFAAAACDLQLRLHFCAFWQGVPYTPVMFYASEANLPVVGDLARLMIISDTLDADGVIGYHAADPFARGIVLAQGAATSVTLSHECLEMAADPQCDQWRTRPDGIEVALEVADPCEADSYNITVSLVGEVRDVPVSNFILPTWFGGVGQLDYMGRIAAPYGLASGGYCIVRDKDGNVTDLWGRTGADAIIRRARKVWNSTSRTYRRGVR